MDSNIFFLLQLFQDRCNCLDTNHDNYALEKRIHDDIWNDGIVIYGNYNLDI